MEKLRPIILALLFSLSFSNSFSQAFTIKGYVSDTLNNIRLRHSSITLVRASDSILESFTRTNERGEFQLQPKKEGNYLIMATFPGFADYVDIVNVSKDKPLADLGFIPMVSKSHLLSEFVLKQQLGSIKIKGDTTEYVADSFIVRENATVEELLKKLPGIQVSKNGEVIAQGEKVQKILVDGEEFFTDDPAVVTKSLQSKAVDKVQVFDKKSDQTVFTGIDDGTREKTINLQLKDNMKKGYFGKINVGAGPGGEDGSDGMFENQGMINAFKGKRKLSAFGIVANTGKIGLGWEDRDKFGGGGGGITEVTDEGNVITYFTGGDDDEGGWGGQYNGQGLPAAWTGGLHFSNKWNKDNEHVSSNYRFARQNVETVGNTSTIMNVPGGQNITVETNQSFKTGDRHRIDGLFEWKFDTSSSLKVTANAGHSNSITRTAYQSSVDSTGFLLNENERTLNSDVTINSLNASLAYRKKFTKPGRTISIMFDEKYRENIGSSDLKSVTKSYIYDPSPNSTDSIIDQHRKTESKNLSLNGSLSYTEPLSKKVFLELNYGLSVNNSFSNRESYDPDGDGDYVVLDKLLSNKYDFNILTNSAGSNLRFVYKKINFSFGGSAGMTNFKQVDNIADTSSERSYTNFFPKASFVYRASQQKTFSINYNGSTRQPSIDQIQPVTRVDDPLNQAKGNANLRQEFNHNINIRYNDYKVFSGVYTYLGSGITFVSDDITRSDSIIGGIRKFQYINMNGNYNGWAYGGYGKQIRKLNLRVGFGGNINVGRTYNIVNGQKNKSENNSFSLRLNADYDKEKKFSLSLSPGITYSTNSSSVNNSTTNYFNYNINADGNVQLPMKFEIGSELAWNIREGVGQFQSNSVVLWHAYVSKKFLKGDNLELRAYVNDILDQNLNFQRFNNGISVTEQTYNSIRRYGMLSLIWNFTKTPGAAPAANDGPRMKMRF
jgi:hypothetical protein